MSTQPKNSDSGVCLFDLLFPDSEMRGWDWSRMPSDSETQRWNWKKDQQLSGPQKRLEDLLRQSGNKLCADCGSPDPKWVSLNLGVFICIKCSGVHRSLGVHISKVFSVKLDNWTDEQVNTFISMGGNADVNKKYEAGIIDLTRKPKPDSCIEERFEFIRRKYELLQFYNGNGHNSSDGSVNKRISSCSQINSSSKNGSQDKRQYEKLATRHRIANAFRNSRVRRDSDHKSFDKSNPSVSRLASAGMVEFVGLVKVNVVRGTNLAIRDVVSSDPYVILSLGHQSVRTRVIKSNLNPVWNESLMLSIPEHIPPLKVLVYDKDTFSTDDFMGEAEIDIQPLVAATRAYEKSTIDESMQLGKWVATNDNTLVKDGIINLVDGKVRQDISLRLQNVERGVLEVELECIPLTQ
ncbi:probable ADP-ribosylation factor GTPase-activating protein AGD11 isoform X1 [Cucurbita maxima]|uniref:Probable ADP-ribosylation factor GTPase-activating protein AGD11 isoform X1 n=1 Tax=Cucurbita maxima TaxID=3661 RepID=A0A6J1JL08_CUCMA|nr:probable ADP-ribosylation factor GTPase-activating protein AGD11 isoform X1 [Cucurbita maxima]XP_022991169.1 probable ADP-ribosylation factor GTPase-activating protein AGD11 isoform X1 [Cucurbita maxima]XP_022991170.1 probable ADP-ribosylation factor GTPase-activating protein AGD11 isoform X1 [Cucurbita maxima]